LLECGHDFGEEALAWILLLSEADVFERARFLDAFDKLIDVTTRVICDGGGAISPGGYAETMDLRKSVEPM
jgi:hypothetical protein